MAIDVILFDLGGVLVELTGVPTMMSWSTLSEEEVWQRWLSSPSVRAFESGRTTPEAFATAVVDELALDATPDAFLDAFTHWPRGPFAGTGDLLVTLGERYHLACLSNTNDVHWQRFHRESDFLDHLHTHFVSHQIGLMKPDREIYEHTIEQLGCPPDNILFLDDNQVNVDGAIACGMNAELTLGLDGVTDQLTRYGLLWTR